MSNKVTFENLFSQNRMVGIVAKERDKFSDVVDAVGIDPQLLKVKDDGANTNQALNLPWQLPDDSADFVKWILDNYTSKDFKALRKANFQDVSLETAEHLIDGFTSMLESLGHNADKVNQQRRIMVLRMHYSVRSSRSDVDETIQELADTLDKFENAPLGMRRDEFPVFLGFVNEQLKDLVSYIYEVYNDYVDIRQNEITDIAWDEAADCDDAEALEEINQALILQDALDKDKHYQCLLVKREKLLSNNDFIKNIEKQFKKVVEEMDSVRRQHEIELFGHELPQKEEKPLTLKHPSVVLQEAIDSVKESREAQRRWEEEQAKITPEQREQMRKCYERICQERGWEPYPYGISPDKPSKEESEP